MQHPAWQCGGHVDPDPARPGEAGSRDLQRSVQGREAGARIGRRIIPAGLGDPASSRRRDLDDGRRHRGAADADAPPAGAGRRVGPQRRCTPTCSGGCGEPRGSLRSRPTAIATMPRQRSRRSGRSTSRSAGRFPTARDIARPIRRLLAWVHVAGAVNFLDSWRRYAEPRDERGRPGLLFRAERRDRAAARRGSGAAYACRGRATDPRFPRRSFAPTSARRAFRDLVLNAPARSIGEAARAAAADECGRRPDARFRA